MSIESPTIAGSSLTLIWEPYWGGCATCPDTDPIVPDKWLHVSVDATTGETPNKGWWKTGTGQTPVQSLEEWAADFDPAFMADAVVAYVGFGVGTYNRGVTSYVHGLSIASDGYDWKWIFGSNQCIGTTATQTFT